MTVCGRRWRIVLKLHVEENPNIVNLPQQSDA